MNNFFSSFDVGVRLEGMGVFLLLLPLLVAFASFAYRRTYPDISPSKRWLLIGLRSVSTGLLAALLAEPVLDIWNKGIEKPRLLLLLDTSPSMGMEEGGSTRLDKARLLFGEPAWKEALARVEMSAWGFADQLYAIDVDTLEAVRPQGQATDIGRALERGLQEVGSDGAFEGVLLLTDGAHNLGRDPVEVAQAEGVPVYALAIGGEQMPADIQVLSVRAAGVGYVHRPLHLEVELKSSGFAGRSTEVVFYEDAREVERRALVLQEGVQRLRFSVRPGEAGAHIYRIVAAPLPGELTRDNNESLAFARVLEERLRVLVVAGRPSVDLAFLRRALEADSSLSVDLRVQKDDGTFYQGEWAPAVLEHRDVLVLLDCDAPLWQGEMGERLRQVVEGGGGLLFIGGPGTARRWNGGGVLADLLPVELDQPAYVQQTTVLQVGPQGENHPLLRRTIGTEEGDPWRNLPPLPGRFVTSSLRRGARVLLEDGEGHPVVVAGVRGRGKVVAALSHSFWRLDLISSGVLGTPQTIRQFWRDAVRWLALSAPIGRVRVSTERHIYRAGAPVVFAAQVFDELLRPQEGAVLRLAIDGREVLQLQDRGGGYYRGAYTSVGPGEYGYEVVAELNGAEIGRGRGRFIVEKHSIEWSDVRANRVLLNEMARLSGGASLAVEDWPQLLRQWNMRPKLVEEIFEMRLWGRAAPLLLIVALLAAEWFLRKRLGMI